MPVKLVQRSGDSAAAVAEASARFQVHINEVKEFVHRIKLHKLLRQDLQGHAATRLQQLKTTVTGVIESRQASRTLHVGVDTAT